jgi:predicted SAM-dependent methyltransferase
MNEGRKILKQRPIIEKMIKEDSLKVHIGCGGKIYDNWMNYPQDEIDITIYKNWCKRFSEGSINIILAEHVFEHLNENGRNIAIKNFYCFLKNNGKIRIAVPDGFNPDKAYIDHVKPYNDGHQVLFNHKTLVEEFSSYGFEYDLLEYFDENGKFHFKEWDIKDGFVTRSKRFDERNQNGKLEYTSLIVDFYKRF